MSPVFYNGLQEDCPTSAICPEADIILTELASKQAVGQEEDIVSVF